MWKYLPEKIQMSLNDRYDCTNDARQFGQWFLTRMMAWKKQCK